MLILCCTALLQILVCVSVNLTVVYALITYSIIKKTDVIGTLVRYSHYTTFLALNVVVTLITVQANMDSSSQHGWPSTKTVLVYSIAW